MRRNLVSNAALLDVVLLRKPKMLLRCDVAKHTCAVKSGRGRTDATGDVIVARENIRHERPQNVERRAVTHRALEFHVVLDLIERNVTGAFHHHLAAIAPRALREFRSEEHTS